MRLIFLWKILCRLKIENKSSYTLLRNVWKCLIIQRVKIVLFPISLSHEPRGRPGIFLPLFVNDVEWRGAKRSLVAVTAFIKLQVIYRFLINQFLVLERNKNIWSSSCHMFLGRRGESWWLDFDSNTPLRNKPSIFFESDSQLWLRCLIYFRVWLTS